MVDFKKLEKKWQTAWEKDSVFKTDNDSQKKKCYVLEMFPYPSASGLHMGHALNYAIGDVFSRFKRMNGFNVLYPMGFDALGLPAENAAIKAKSHPKEFTKNAIKNYMRQMHELGLSYDWSRMVSTMEPEYYKWNQFFFLKFLEKGLAYRRKAPVNWCPSCNTVISNEQAQGGVCERCDAEIEIKHLEQWYLKTTKYADELLEKLDELEWPDKIKAMQRNWIGKSHGTEIFFEINGESWPIFTTRPDTIFGVTFMVVAAQHPKLMDLVTKEQEAEVKEFLKKVKSTSEKDQEALEKEGAFTGSYAINPLTKDKIPVYTGNFVLAEYGSGMVMAVPAHDQRDFEFAKKYDIPVKVVINPDSFDLNPDKMARAFTSDGNLVNSDKFNKLSNRTAIDEITKELSRLKKGRSTIQYKLRDCGFSRQRYWGTPIPIIKCEECGLVPVPEKDLPVVLPENVEFGKGNPLETNKDWLNVSCPKCGKDAQREPDTMDTFFDSSWYFLRYCDNKNDKEPFKKDLVKYWMPVDQYIGGAEHACMHLIYARFFTKALRDLGFVNFDEPFTKLFNQGMLHGPDGDKMSKSKGNVINPDDVANKYGMDTARFFLLSLAAPDKPRDWSESGIEGSLRFINRVFNFFNEIKAGESTKKLESKLNQAIKNITNNIETFQYNLAIINLRELFAAIEKEESVSNESLEVFLKLLHPFCPHITEELWEKVGNKPFISLQSWSEADESKIDATIDALDELSNNVSADITKVLTLAKIEKPKKVTLFISESWKYSFFNKLKSALNNTRNMSDLIKATLVKCHEKDIPKIIQSVLKDASKLPATITSQKQELDSLKQESASLKSKFNAEVELIKAEDSKEAKAKSASPGKPAILVE